MKNALLAIAVTVLAASPALAGPRGGSTTVTSGGLIGLGAVNVSALNGISVLNNIASGNRAVVSLPGGILNGNRTGVLNGNRTNVLSGVKGIVGGLIGGGHGCGCN